MTYDSEALVNPIALMKLADILKDSNYKLSQFTAAEIEQLEQSITLKTTKSGDVPHVVCLVRQKAIKLTPEEVVRQLYLQVLMDRLHYPVSRIQVEYGVNFGVNFDFLKQKRHPRNNS